MHAARRRRVCHMYIDDVTIENVAPDVGTRELGMGRHLILIAQAV